MKNARFANTEKQQKMFFHVDLILRIGYRWIFREDLISPIWQKFAKISKICLVNNFSPQGSSLIKWLKLSKIFESEFILTVQPCKLYNNKYMIASRQIANTKIFAFIAALVLKLLSCTILFIRQ